MKSANAVQFRKKGIDEFANALNNGMLPVYSIAVNQGYGDLKNIWFLLENYYNK